VEMQKQAAIRDAYRQANRLRVAARRAREWIRMFQKPQLDFRYEIRDLFISYMFSRQKTKSTFNSWSQIHLSCPWNCT